MSNFLRSPRATDYLLILPVYFIAYFVINCIIKPVVGASFADRYMGTGPGGAFNIETLQQAVKQSIITILIIIVVIWLFMAWATHN